MKKTLLSLALAVLCLLAACAQPQNTASSAAAEPTAEPASKPTPTATPTPTPAPPIHFEFTAPRGFYEQGKEALEDEIGIKRGWWAEDGSNINLAENDVVDGAYDAINGELLRSSLEEVMIAVFGDGVEVELEDFHRAIFKGYPMYRCLLHIQEDEIKMDMKRLTFCIEADKEYTWTFTDRNGRYMDDFEKSIKEMKILEGPDPDEEEEEEEEEKEAKASATPASTATPTPKPSPSPTSKPTATPSPSPTAKKN